MRQRAEAQFHNTPQDLNCAQAVLAAYQEASGDTRFDLESFRAHGGGRAPLGTCGAIHAACLILPEAELALKTAFFQEAGQLDCASLRMGGEISCRECVGIAAELLEAQLKQS
nr:hypothetical protein [uncultured Holophaga sp.]